MQALPAQHDGVQDHVVIFLVCLVRETDMKVHSVMQLVYLQEIMAECMQRHDNLAC